MKKRERFKRVINFFEGVIILAIHVVIFAFVWYGSYVKQLEIPFFRKGDWAVIGIYGLILFLLSNLYGGFKILGAKPINADVPIEEMPRIANEIIEQSGMSL